VNAVIDIPDAALTNYVSFLESKKHYGAEYGFAPEFMPDILFPFQRSLVEWSTRKGRSAIFADCGLGKTFMQLVWAENVARKTNGRCLILTPLAVAFQTVIEGQKIGIEVSHRREGIHPADRIVVTNYKRLHYFNPEDFQGVVCDESSILKNFDGATRKAITEFMRTRPYRLLCTATAAPNDYIELGTSSEALGYLGYSDMVSVFFKRTGKTLSRKDERRSGVFQLRGHAERDFWRWVCSWARAMRKPSDLGYGDGTFVLPDLTYRDHVVESRTLRDGYLFDIPAIGLSEQRADLSRTVEERCEMAAELINSHNNPAVAWCNLNSEGKSLARMIPDGIEICGNDSDEKKEEVFIAFARGNVRVIITKPTIAGFGLNWQHCAHQTFFPSHSYEQFYQCVRRSWRFGQSNPVTVDVITTRGQEDVLNNLNRKADQANRMFTNLVQLMWQELRIEHKSEFTKKEEIPTWLLKTK